MVNFAQVGNDLYTGKRSIDFIKRQKTWYAFSGILIVLAFVGIFARGLNFGIEFRGGTEFRVLGVTNTQGYEEKAQGAVGDAGIGGNVESSIVGQNTVRVQTEAAAERTDEARTALAQSFGVPEGSVSASLIGPSWGESVSKQAIQGLIVFLILVTIVMAVYFRTWKMAVAGLVALVHDLVITVGIYALFGFEITPSSMIGFLTILGYSLYDTVVVFDKVRENTAEAFRTKRMTYAAAANLAVNQTLVRSINTTVVALLPIAAVLFVGFTFLGPGTLLDLSLALFIGIGVGAYSSIFIATPLLVDLRRNEPAVRELAKYVARHGARQAEREAAAVVGAPQPVAVGADSTGAASTDRSGAATRAATGSASGSTAEGAPRPLHKYAQAGPRNQPKHTPKSRR
jgi:preprotein translocase subunit SecF